MTNIQHQSSSPLQTSNAPGPQTKTERRAEAAAQEFEAFFLSQILNNMSAGIQTDETFGGGESEKIFRSMLNDEYATSMSRQGGVGIADTVYREILALQEI
ncbi:MAG: rod-binding protein [Sneathiella sp.]